MDNQISNPPLQNQNISTLPAPIYAGFFRRFFATLIDGLFTGILGGALSFIVGNDIIIALSMGTIVGVIYDGIFNSSELMGTPGKALLGIAIVQKNNHEKISFKTAIIRYLLKYVSSLMLGIGYLIQPFTEHRQAFHDIFADTLVIKKNVGEINYFKAFKDNFSRIVNG